MGYANVCLSGEYETLFYVSNDLLHVYRALNDLDNDSGTMMLGELSYEQLTAGCWEYDPFLSDIVWEDTLANFREAMRAKFHSLSDCDTWITRSRKAILENELFYIAIEDNIWGIAFELVMKEHWCYSLVGLQKKHFNALSEGMKDALFSMFDELGIYAGPYTHGTIKRSGDAA